MPPFVAIKNVQKYTAYEQRINELRSSKPIDPTPIDTISDDLLTTQYGLDKQDAPTRTNNNPDPIATVNVASADDKCLRCGELGHYVTNCKVKRNDYQHKNQMTTEIFEGQISNSRAHQLIKKPKYYISKKSHILNRSKISKQRTYTRCK